MKINNNTAHLLRLIEKEADPLGWAKVSEIVWPLVQSLPSSLVEWDGLGGKKVRLTQEGKIVVKWM